MNYCSKCGISEDDADYEMLVPIQVVVAEGEEGFANITMLLCDEHLIEVTDGLVALGFKDHRHGGINYLEDRSCVGALGKDGCPTPDTDDDAFRTQGIVLGQKSQEDQILVTDEVYGDSEGEIHLLTKETGDLKWGLVDTLIADLVRRVRLLEETVNTPGPGDR